MHSCCTIGTDCPEHKLPNLTGQQGEPRRHPEPWHNGSTALYEHLILLYNYIRNVCSPFVYVDGQTCLFVYVLIHAYPFSPNVCSGLDTLQLKSQED